MEQKDLVMTKELREKLQGFLAFQTDAIYKYIPAPYRKKKEGEYVIPKEFWPIFSIRFMDGVEISELEDKVGYTVIRSSDPDYREFHGRSGTYRLDVLRNGVKGWINLRDEKGNLVEYSGDDSLSKLPVDLQQDLQVAIMERIVLTEEELRSLGS